MLPELNIDVRKKMRLQNYFWKSLFSPSYYLCPLLLVVAEFLTEEEERRPAPEEIADSLRVDPARPLLKELEDEGLVVDPEFLKEEEPLLRPPV